VRPARERSGDFSQSFLDPVDPFTGQPFSAVSSLTCGIQSYRKAIAALYPCLTQRALQNLVSSPTQRDRNDSFDVRLDHR